MVGGLFAVAVTILVGGPLAAEQATCIVDYSTDRLTVHARGASLDHIVQEVARQSGAEIVGTVRKPRDVSQEFEGVPLVDALARLLGDQNFTLRYGPEGELRSIHLLGEALSPVSPSALVSEASNARESEKSSSEPHARGGGVRSSRETLPDGGVLVTSRAKGTRDRSRRKKRHDQGDETPQTPGLSGVPVQSTAAQDETNQGKPDQQLTADQLERKLRRSFLGTLDQMDDAALTEYLATPEGQRAAAFLQYLSAHHPSSSSYQKANGIIDRVPSLPPSAPRRPR